jgi:general secretion pathway protein G
MGYNLHKFRGVHVKTDKFADPKGFTLVELLVVMGVIAILVVIVIPQYSLYITKGCNASALSDMKNFKVAMESFFADHAEYPTLLY